MKVFITTNALTRGIEEVDAEVSRNFPDTIQWQAGRYGANRYARKPHWHETLHEAFTRAETMRVARIASLRKSIAKLEKLKFEVVA